jgi:hypothetical protein
VRRRRPVAPLSSSSGPGGRLGSGAEAEAAWLTTPGQLAALLRQLGRSPALRRPQVGLSHGTRRWPRRARLDAGRRGSLRWCWLGKADTTDNSVTH